MGAYPTPQAAADVLARVRRLRPRVHCLMNTVVQKFTADGITVVSFGQPAKVAITDCRVEANARAGVSSFGAEVSIEGTELTCNAIQLDSESSGPPPDGACQRTW